MFQDFFIRKVFKTLIKQGVHTIVIVVVVFVVIVVVVNVVFIVIIVVFDCSFLIGKIF